MNPNDITPPPGFQPRSNSDGAGSQPPMQPLPQSEPPRPSFTPPSAAHQHPKRSQGLRDFLSIVAVLASALLLALGLISFVFQSYEVDGPSMNSTLQNNDHLIVWKVPRTLARITHHAYVPDRADIIVFNEPGLPDFGQYQSKQLIKRVIGLPGERVVVKDGQVTIYNAEHPEGFDPDKTLPYGKVIGDTSGNVDITLSNDQIFVCGDNRPNSLDSRVQEVGPISLNNIVGKLVLRVLPLSDAERF